LQIHIEPLDPGFENPKSNKDANEWIDNLAVHNISRFHSRMYFFFFAFSSLHSRIYFSFSSSIVFVLFCRGPDEKALSQLKSVKRANDTRLLMKKKVDKNANVDCADLSIIDNPRKSVTAMHERLVAVMNQSKYCN
jgi:hypothetical protein